MTSRLSLGRKDYVTILLSLVKERVGDQPTLVEDERLCDDPTLVGEIA